MPGVAELRRFALADEASNLDAESRAAWDILTRHVGKWGRWGEDYLHAYIEEGAPTLPPRVVNTVRRTGGWGAYLGLSYTDDQRRRDAAFQQKRFFEEYKAWTLTEISLPMLAASLQLPEHQIKQLTKPMEAPKRTPPPDGALCRIVEIPKRVVNMPMPPALQLTKEQIEARRAAEQEEIKRYASNQRD